jgi:hypothetical protein
MQNFGSVVRDLMEYGGIASRLSGTRVCRFLSPLVGRSAVTTTSKWDKNRSGSK